MTIVAYHRICMFGEVVQDEMRLNNFGKIVTERWEWLPQHYPYIDIGTFIVMPNHFHGILWILESDDNRRGGSRPAPTGLNDDLHPIGIQTIKNKPLGQLLGAFKTTSAKGINMIRASSGMPIWQRNFYERIIRDEIDLNQISEYILTNPQTWAKDPEYML